MEGRSSTSVTNEEIEKAIATRRSRLIAILLENAEKKRIGDVLLGLVRHEIVSMRPADISELTRDVCRPAPLAVYEDGICLGVYGTSINHVFLHPYGERIGYYVIT